MNKKKKKTLQTDRLAMPLQILSFNVYFQISKFSHNLAHGRIKLWLALA